MSVTQKSIQEVEASECEAEQKGNYLSETQKNITRGVVSEFRCPS